MERYTEMNWRQYFADLQSELKVKADEYYKNLFETAFGLHEKTEIIDGKEFTRWSILQETDIVREMNKPQ